MTLSCAQLSRWPLNTINLYDPVPFSFYRHAMLCPFLLCPSSPTVQFHKGVEDTGITLMRGSFYDSFCCLGARLTIGWFLV